MAIPNNCYKICDYYYFGEDSKYECTLSNECPLKYNKLISDKEKCIDDCKMDDKYIYIIIIIIVWLNVQKLQKNMKKK